MTGPETVGQILGARGGITSERAAEILEAVQRFQAELDRTALALGACSTNSTTREDRIMDVNATLAAIREIIEAERGGADVDAAVSLARLDTLAELVEALDGWLSAPRSGFLPDAWSGSAPRPTCAGYGPQGGAA
jgi:hypothetical protein